MLALTDSLLRETGVPPRSSRNASPRWWPSVPRDPSRWSSTLLVLFLVADLFWLPAIAPSLRVKVAGRPLVLQLATATVADALNQSQVVPVDGALLAAVTKKPVDPHFDRAVVRVDGRPVALTSKLESGDRITVVNGQNAVEPTVRKAVPIPAGGLPAIEYDLWHPPKNGEIDRVVGERSGEVVSESIVRQPVAASPVAEPVVALTFDDGPNPAATPQILGILHNAGVKATFCVVGYAARRHPELVKAIRDEGHVLCDHTANHTQKLGSKPAAMIVSEIKELADIVDNATGGARPRFFRAPGGTWSAPIIDEAARQGMRSFGWNIDPEDFRKPGAAVITERVLQVLRPGAVILLHDGGGDRSQTVAQLQALIDGVRRAVHVRGPARFAS